MFQSLFYWIINSYNGVVLVLSAWFSSFNPYFTGLSILIRWYRWRPGRRRRVSILILLDYQFLFNTPPRRVSHNFQFQSLFYWIINSYKLHNPKSNTLILAGFNPYFTGLSILIREKNSIFLTLRKVSILILLDYQFL